MLVLGFACGGTEEKVLQSNKAQNKTFLMLVLGLCPAEAWKGFFMRFLILEDLSSSWRNVFR